MEQLICWSDHFDSSERIAELSMSKTKEISFAINNIPFYRNHLWKGWQRAKK